MNLTDMRKDGNELFNFDRDLNENFEILDNTFGNLPQGVPPSNCANLRIEKNGTSVQLKWKDPSDTVIENQTVCTWAKTLIVRKAGDYPANPSEGEIIATNTIRNQYNLTALADTLPDETNEYFTEHSQYQQIMWSISMDLINLVSLRFMSLLLIKKL